MNSDTLITPESVLAAVKEMLAESRADFDQRMKKLSEQIGGLANNQGAFAESRAEFDKEMAKSRADFDRRMKKLSEQVGGVANNQGAFAEEYFFNSFERGQTNFFNEKFDKIKQNMKGDETDDEFDIVMLNGQTLGIVEVKFKAHQKDIPKVIKKAETFRENFPKYKNHKIYLGLASMAFYPKLEHECLDKGIAIVKQVGDTVVVNDAHLRAY